jgi:nitrogen fixation NifU-like protein
MAKGKTLDEALAITNGDVAAALGGLPPEKIHCSLLAEQGIKAAVENYRRREAGLPPLEGVPTCFGEDPHEHEIEEESPAHAG